MGLSRQQTRQQTATEPVLYPDQDYDYDAPPAHSAPRSTFSDPGEGGIIGYGLLLGPWLTFLGAMVLAFSHPFAATAWAVSTALLFAGAGLAVKTFGWGWLITWPVVGIASIILLLKGMQPFCRLDDAVRARIARSRIFWPAHSNMHIRGRLSQSVSLASV